MRSPFREIGRFSRDTRLLMAYNMLANIGVGVFGVVFNLYLVNIGLHERFIGAFNAVQMLTMAIACWTIGSVLNRFGTWRAMIIGGSVYLVSALGLALTAAPVALLALAAVYGVGLAFLWNVTMPFVMEFTPRDQRQHVASINFSLTSLAAMVGSLLGGLVPAILALLSIADHDTIFSYRGTLVAGTVIGAFGVIPLLLMKEARKANPKDGPTAAAMADEPETNPRQVRRDMRVFAATGGIMSIGVGMVIPFYNVYLTQLGAGTATIGYVFAVAGLLSAVGGLFSPAMSRRFGPLMAVAIVRLSYVPVYVALAMWPGIGLAVVAHFWRQVGIAMAWPIDGTFIGEVLPLKDRKSVFGWRSGAWNLGWALSSLAGGFMIKQYGYSPAMLSLVLFTVLSTLLFVGYFGRHPLVRSGAVNSGMPEWWVRGGRNEVVSPTVSGD